MPESNSKTGYLKEACRLFHLCGLPERSVAYHYHDFHKLLYLMEGEIGYEVEGISYRLEPGDLMLVGAGSLHRPIFDHTESYERLIFYLSPSLMLRSPWTVSRGKGFEEIINAGSGKDWDPLSCFSQCRRPGSNLYRPSGTAARKLQGLVQELVQNHQRQDPYALILQELKKAELLLCLSRLMTEQESDPDSLPGGNPTVQACIEYINSHLSEDSLSIDILASHAFMSRSRLMHLFKEETGSTINSFITEKRLYLASSLLDKGMGVTDACYQSGFGNYSAFYYAYRRRYHSSPMGKGRMPDIDNIE